jgi:hypothetical protein
VRKELRIAKLKVGHKPAQVKLATEIMREIERLEADGLRPGKAEVAVSKIVGKSKGAIEKIRGRSKRGTDKS